MLFPRYKFSTNPVTGIPVLLPRFSSELTLPFVAWGSRSRYAAFTGTYHFFVDDFRFEALWNCPDKITGLNFKETILVEPDFSIPDDSDFPIFLYQLYRRRYLSRYWQSLGFRIIPNISAHSEFVSSVFDGISKDCQLYVTSGIATIPDLVSMQFDFIPSDSASLIVCGGNKAVRSFCESTNRIIWVPAHRQAVREIINNQEVG